MSVEMPSATELDERLQRFAARGPDGEPVEDGNELLRFWNAAPEAAAQLLDLELALWRRGSLGPRLAELVRLAVANHTHCPVCLSIRYPRARDAGVDESLIARIPDGEDPRLSPRERAAIEYAACLAGDHQTIGEAHYARLAEHFDERERAELTMLCALFLGMGRFLETLTRGMACPLPTPDDA